MVSRYPSSKYVDYCFNPVHVVDDDKDIIVPCGKCDGCLLHKANEWSMRCGMEIEGSPATIFGTLTYNNFYLPKLIRVKDSLWISDYPDNVRFNGVHDVRREDNIVIYGNYPFIPIQKWDNEKYPSINYASKRDIQLWLKLLRKDLDLHEVKKDKRILDRGYFRYFIISEVGPTTHRSHFHFLIFCQSDEVASYLLEGSLYKNWQMCDEDRFEPYVHLCDSGARGYVTQYLTCSSVLPKVYAENKSIRPFRLASKSPGIGFIEQDKSQIYEDVSRGVIHYSRPVRRLESVSLLEYPSGFTSTLFPKCYRFNKISDRGRFCVYVSLYREIRKNGRNADLCCQRFREILLPQDYLAACACDRFCREYVDSPEYYYYLLDTYYYKVAMQRLKDFYLSQEECNFKENPYKIFEYYPNIEVLCLDETQRSIFSMASLYAVLSPFGFDYRELLDNKNFFLDLKKRIMEFSNVYRLEVEDIKENMLKMPKYNEMTLNAPTII